MSTAVKPKKQIHISTYNIGYPYTRAIVTPIIDDEYRDDLSLFFVVDKKHKIIKLDTYPITNPITGEHVIIPHEDREWKISGIPYGSRLSKSDIKKAVENYAKYIYHKYYNIF